MGKPKISFYCVVCKKKEDSSNYTIGKTKNGVKQARAKLRCGHKAFRFMKKNS